MNLNKYIKFNLVITFLVASCFNSILPSRDFTSNPDVNEFIENMEEKHDFKREELLSLMSSGEYQERVVRIMDRQPEGTLTWSKYKGLMINESRINSGKEFINLYRDTLERAEDVYGVPSEIIASIIGIETRFGQNKGNTRVLDSLMTLSFEYPRREKFFKIQLENFLLLAREEALDPGSIKGSIAGAMGFGQFMPDSYRKYAVDFDSDGKRDLFNSPVDAIGSVANFLSKKGKWRPNQGIAVRAFSNSDSRPNIKSSFKPSFTIVDLQKKGLSPMKPLLSNQKYLPVELQLDNGYEYWIGMHNYQSLSRYNRSKLYIMAVIELSNSLVDFL